jgi:outer membrane murein-binding lipoprotein Lpp
MSMSSLSDLFKTLSLELRELAKDAEAMHELVCPDHAQQDAAYVRAVQRIDRTQQTLCNLSTFLEAAREELPASYEVALKSALETVRLNDLKLRLVPSASFDGGPVAVESDGEMELFSQAS